ncbi:MAG: ArsR family transcriptional regulator [Desulfarculales bacterium]|jgi:hypothetical protein|nr:ArsR family transcriptional regulator [Desulfarculales bacterium]
MSQQKIWDEDRRLVILRLLTKHPEINIFVLQRSLKLYAHPRSLDGLKADGAWLEEQGLITVTDEGVHIFKLTARGGDVAAGMAICPGVTPPRPGFDDLDD